MLEWPINLLSSKHKIFLTPVMIYPYFILNEGFIIEVKMFCVFLWCISKSKLILKSDVYEKCAIILIAI